VILYTSKEVDNDKDDTDVEMNEE